MGEAALELHAITKRFHSVTALENASLSVRRNSIHALLGENAAGKTTLMRIAFGMVQMYRTHAGLGLRAIGEDPRAAVTAGIPATKVQTLAVLFGGFLGVSLAAPL